MRTVVGGGRDTHDGHENSPILVFFSNLLGVVAGLVLRPLAVVLFFVPGTVLDMVHQQQCPYCAGWVTSETRVCAHCSAMLISGWG